MRIGVITFSTSKDNYGQLLQCFAMQNYLRNQGHDVFLIRYQNNITAKASFKITRTFTYLRKLPLYISFFLTQQTNKKNKNIYGNDSANERRKFNQFIIDNLVTTERVYTEDELNTNPPSADAFICGSDQIWGGDLSYFLSFAPDETRKLAYAPSFGGRTEFSPEYEKTIKQLLARFDFIGVREQSGVDVCHRLGFPDAVKVIDPTLLLSITDYDKIRISTHHKRPYIFLYLLGNPMICKVPEIYSFAKHEGLEVIYVGSQGQNDAYEKEYPQIGEWIDLIANAELVITNSFHCSVFSLIYQKKFITIPLNKGFERMNGRIDELLKSADLEFARFKGDFKHIYHNIYNFETFNRYQKQEIEKSHKYLNNVLK